MSMVVDAGRMLQRNLGHLRPPPLGGKWHNRIPTYFRPRPKFVQVKDRIPFWYIAPGDKVQLVKGSKELKRITAVVDKVDRMTNRVWLKGTEFARKKRQPAEFKGQTLDPSYNAPEGGVYQIPRSFHVSNLRLVYTHKNEEFVATRVKQTKVTWNRRLRGGASSGLWKIGQSTAAVHKNPAVVCAHQEAMRNNFMPDLSKLSLVPRPEEIPRDPSKYPKLPTEAPPEVKVGILDVGGAYWSRANRMKRFRLKKEEEKKYGKEKMKEAIADRAEKKRQLLKRLLA
ncbi:translation protein SH3-like domain protein [Rhodotorula toruloides]|uniref:Translation protein SH3-like domain protein n=1 Tax=Rhodotorula toruloides TaxID=5286 RepID=A0A511KGD2_RHOTO|nr:translation protein SH3-like domain protein [Rhodotorula toruloides]